ncbi:putative pentatricopeptide repeat-containing protein [Hibiscus syriacus]|uniref:Putative pentatricopeptide repeat-containing protein n=1 Tax=Hibiscus syriacus TaxID=106335 RepID=A0A6A3BXA6_HIBSY|nr:putative pentatricopeptide repeat-containing protein [Hibiscus syriacus]
MPFQLYGWIAPQKGQSLGSSSVVRQNGRNTVSTNMMISGYVESGDLLSARDMFDAMPYRTAVTWTIMIGCNDAEADKKLIQVHACVIKLGYHSSLTGFVCNVFVGNALLDFYSKHDCLVGVRKFFGEMPDLDGISYDVIITCYAWFAQHDEAIRLFRELQFTCFNRRQFPFVIMLSIAANAPDLKMGQQIHSLAIATTVASELVVGNSLVDMYAKCGRFEEAEKISRTLAKRSTVPWTAIISGYVQRGFNEEGLNLFNEMHKSGVRVDQATFASILKASANLTSLSLGKQIHSFIVRSGFMSNVFSGSALLDMYAKCGSIKDAIQLFQDKPERNIVSWNALISAHAQNGDPKATLDTFEKMVQSGFQPDSVSFLSVLSACSHCGLVQEGLRYFRTMTEMHDLVPKKEHCASMVDMLCRSGRFHEAQKMMAEMPFEPDEIIRSSVLNSCRIHKNQELAMKAADELFQMEVLRDAAPYVSMSNIYAAAGQWDNVGKMEEIRKKIDILSEQTEKEGYRPDTSCALHDVDEKMKIEPLKYHSERLAIAFALIRTPEESPVLVMKNLRACTDCHAAIKVMSKIVRREITVWDSSRFHHFKDGICSCGDYW